MARATEVVERKLDIFELLRAVDRRDGDWYAKQPADVRKEFVPLTAQRWVATVEDGKAAPLLLVMVNDYVNVHLFELQHHPELVYRLLALCGAGKRLSHKWFSGTKRKTTNKAFELLAHHHPEASDRELELLMSLHTKESFTQFVGECGLQADAAKEVIKHYGR